MIEAARNIDTTGGKTFQYQNKLPNLPIPDLKSTIQRYLIAVKPIQVKTKKKVSLMLLILFYPYFFPLEVGDPYFYYYNYNYRKEIKTI